jgi:two-component system nitrogen regulation response regulator GlnG
MDNDKLTLLDHFRRLYAGQSGVQPFTLDETAERRWLDYAFPGNVRELRNIVIRLTTKYAGQRLSVAEVEPEFDFENGAEGPLIDAAGRDIVEQALKHLEREGHFHLDEMLKAWERGYIEAALKLARGNVSQAARLLGVNRTTLYSRMESKTADPDGGSPVPPPQTKTR